MSPFPKQRNVAFKLIPENFVVGCSLHTYIKCEKVTGYNLWFFNIESITETTAKSLMETKNMVCV